jgi:hypothetical protein
VQLFGIWLGQSTDLPSILFGVVMAGLLLLGGLRPSRSLQRWIPAGAALALFLFGPHQAFGTAFLYQRFAVFVLPLSLLALEPMEPPRQARARPFLLAFVLGWMALLSVRYRSFDADARDLDPLLATMEPNRRVQSLTFELGSNDVPGFPCFLHHAVWYQVERGGVMGFSFALFFPELLRYRAGAAPPITPFLEWHPERFNWQRDGRDFDYFLVRSSREMGAALFGTKRVVLQGRSGLFWLYKHVRDTPR